MALVFLHCCQSELKRLDLTDVVNNRGRSRRVKLFKSLIVHSRSHPNGNSTATATNSSPPASLHADGGAQLLPNPNMRDTPGSYAETLDPGRDASAELNDTTAEPPCNFKDDMHDEGQESQDYGGNIQHSKAEVQGHAFRLATSTVDPKSRKHLSAPADMDDGACSGRDGTGYATSFKPNVLRVRKSVTFAPDPELTRSISDVSNSTNAPDVGCALALERLVAYGIAVDTLEHMAAEKVCAAGEQTLGENILTGRPRNFLITFGKNSLKHGNMKPIGS